MNQTNTSSAAQSVTRKPWAYFAVVLSAVLLLSGCSEEVVDHPIDLSNRVEHQFPQQHLSKLDSICNSIRIHSSGEYLYLATFREKKNYTDFYDLKFYDIKTGDLATLADLGSEYNFHFEREGRLYVTRAPAHDALRQLRCYEKMESIAPLGDRIFDWILQMNGKLLIRDGQRTCCYIDGKEVGSLDSEPDFIGFAWTHPRQNLALLKYSRDEGNEGEVGYKYSSTYYLATFDNSLNILDQKAILQETQSVKYGQFQVGRENELLFTRRIDTNGDNVSNYKDTRNANLMSMNLKTLEISVVCEDLKDLWYFKAHKNGRILFYDETEEDQGGNLWFLDRSSKARHVVMPLDGGRFMGFNTDENWRKLAYVKVLDTNNDDYHLFQEDISEVYLVDLQGLMENKL